MHFSKVKTLLVLFICFFGIAFSVPSFLKDNVYEKLPSYFQQKINLGLELKGGSYLQLQVALDEAYKTNFEKLNVRKLFKKNKIGFEDYKIDKDAIFVRLKDIKDYDNVSKLIGSFDRALSVGLNGKVLRIYYAPNQKRELDLKLVEQSIEVVRRRIDETGTKEPLIYRQGVDRIIVQLPGVDDPGRVKQLLGQTGRLVFKLLSGVVGQDKAFNKEILVEKDTGVKYYVEPEVLLSGEDLTTVKVFSEGSNGVSFELNSFGTERFKDITSKNIGRRLAIVIDNKIVTAPKITQAIPYGQAMISSEKTTLEEATRLKIILSSGSLPAPLKVMEERVVGPSLGADSIEHGKAAVLWSFILVAAFMLLAYRLFGFFAIVSLVFNVVLLFATLSFIGATLTLPGIAGIALTMGVAVDANVLIYERIKEELRFGMKPVRAIILGFERAMTTIVDSNLTTLIGAFILYEFGSGPIRGFAVTLGLGIVISMFTALTLTQMQIYFWIRNRKVEKLSIGGRK
ncbi:MAG: protein translocase subunit SecD [Alphaproteobacteria bacterium]|nr:MAG: protein translocase subunit SecD [Alphaproteobacteria bacterium]